MHNTFSQTLIPQQKTTLEQLVWSEPLPLRFLFLAYTCGMFFCCYSSSISGFSVLCFIPLLPVSSAWHFHLQNICLDVFFFHHTMSNPKMDVWGKSQDFLKILRPGHLAQISMPNSFSLNHAVAVKSSYTVFALFDASVYCCYTVGWLNNCMKKHLYLYS